MFRLGGELLFGVGQHALGWRAANALPGVGLDGFDLGEDLFSGLAHRRSSEASGPLRDYA